MHGYNNNSICPSKYNQIFYMYPVKSIFKVKATLNMLHNTLVTVHNCHPMFFHFHMTRR